MSESLFNIRCIELRSGHSKKWNPTAHVDNDVSAEVYPIYRIKHVTENGYLGIVHPGGALEVGNREEADKEEYQRSEVLLNKGDLT